MINGKDLSRVNYRFRVIVVCTSANSQFPMANWRYRSSDRTYTLSPLTFLYTIFDNPASPAPANAYATRRTPLETVRYLPLTVRRLRFPSRTPSSARCPRFHRCALNNFHRQHSLNVPGFSPRNRPSNPRPRSNRIELLFPSFPKS